MLAQGFSQTCGNRNPRKEAKLGQAQEGEIFLHSHKRNRFRNRNQVPEMEPDLAGPRKGIFSFGPRNGTDFGAENGTKSGQKIEILRRFRARTWVKF
jgi:hypothetical protein